MAMNKTMKENTWYCIKCNVAMKQTTLPYYEFQEGVPVPHVPALQCPSCLKILLTEKQAKAVEARTDKLLEQQFGFERKLTTSGESLVIGVPHELAGHLGLKAGKKVKIFPLNDDGFIVRKIEA